MRDESHREMSEMRNLNRFRRWILLPVTSASALVGGFHLYRGHWFEGIILFSVAVVLGIIATWLNSPHTLERIEGDERAGGVSEVQSQFFTRGLVWSTLTLFFATVTLATYSAADAFWVAGLKGLGIAVLYASISIIVLLPLLQYQFC